MLIPVRALLIAEKVVECMQQCNWPEGAFSLLFGEGRTIGQALVSHPVIKAVGFTDPGPGGRALFDLASKRPEPIPVFAEMSSVNPVFVLSKMEGEEMDQFAEGLAGSKNSGCGAVLYKSVHCFPSSW